jgi:hypothetical protein
MGEGILFFSLIYLNSFYKQSFCFMNETIFDYFKFIMFLVNKTQTFHSNALIFIENACLL